MKRLLYILFLLPLFCFGQNTTTVIPGSLRVVKVPNTIVVGDSLVTIDPSGNIKKTFKYAITLNNGLTLTGTNGQLGGTLIQNTLINTGGFNLSFNNGTAGGANVLQLQSFGSNVTTFDVAGNMHANGVAMLSSPLNGLVDLSGSKVSVIRNTANSASVFAVVNANTGSTGNIIDLRNPAYAVWSLGWDGSIMHKPISNSVAGLAMGYSMVGALKPTANGDLLVGMDLHPAFGASTITTVGSLVGGSGYPDGTHLSNVSGGTGQQAVIQVVVSSGVVTSASVVDGGVNYVNSDVLGIVITDSSGNPIGSGGSVTVTGVANYSGLTNYALRTWGLDVYDQEYNYTSLSKITKNYADTHIQGVSLSTVTQGLQLAPKMSTTQKNAIVSPVEGWVVYDTTLHVYQFWNNSAWTNL